MFEVGVPMSDCVERLKKIEGLKNSYIGAIIATDLLCEQKSFKEVVL